MLQKSGIALLLLTAGFSISCGTATPGSLHQTQTGVSESGYPGGKPTDAESPATGGSTEQKYSREAEHESSLAGAVPPATTPAK